MERDMQFTQKELLELAEAHEAAAKIGLSVGPNIKYVRTFQACAYALRIAATRADKEDDVPLIFRMNLEETREVGEWIAEHDKGCLYADPAKTGAIGGRLTFSFTETTIGRAINVTCACGSACDPTDYTSW